MDYRGSPNLINTRILVCPSCYDQPQPQLSPVILSPDPPPIYNARPEAYALDETSWIGIEDSDDILATQDDDPLVIQINPSSDPNTVHLTSSIASSGGSVTTAYLDLFNGNPASGGTSVLAAITGSSTRTNVASDLTTVLGIAQNPDFIIVTSSAVAQTNISYAAIYSAASGGTLLMSGALAVVGPPPSITVGAPVVFDPLALQIDLN